MFRSARRLRQCETALVIRFRAQACWLKVTCEHRALYTCRGRLSTWPNAPETICEGRAATKWPNGMNDDAHKTALVNGCRSRLPARRTPHSEQICGGLAKRWRKVIACLKRPPTTGPQILGVAYGERNFQFISNWAPKAHQKLRLYLRKFPAPLLKVLPGPQKQQ
jgi:hypothetical protein